MRTRQTTAASTTDSEKHIRQQLERVLTSATFREAGRLRRFLEFIVTETISGRADQLKEYVVGLQVFDRKEGFDPRTDPIVRGQARRLRASLERYYREEGNADELLIDLPKGGYTPVFRSRERATNHNALVATLISRNAVAVLPFADNSPANDCGYFCRGLQEEITSRLSRLRNLRVLAPSAEGQNGNHPKPAAVISGSVRKA